MLTTIEGIYENGVVRLLEPLTGITRARVVVTVLPPMSAADATPLPAPDNSLEAFKPVTELGQQLLAIRQRALATGMKPMSQDEVLAEVRRRRGEDE